MKIDVFDLDDNSVDWDTSNSGLESEVKKLQHESEIRYIKIVENIVDSSKQQLTNQHDNKTKSRKVFQIFFISLLCFQMFSVVALIALSALSNSFKISDNVIITFITSMFVETLGIVGIMIKFNFDNSQEIQILKILHGVISNFQKFHK